MVITAASMQDRDGARPLLWNPHRADRRITLEWADAGYAGKLTFGTRVTLHLGVAVVAPGRGHRAQAGRAHLRAAGRPPLGGGTDPCAWISQHRRTVRDDERLPGSHEAVITWAVIALMARHLARELAP